MKLKNIWQGIKKFIPIILNFYCFSRDEAAVLVRWMSATALSIEKRRSAEGFIDEDDFLSTRVVFPEFYWLMLEKLKKSDPEAWSHLPLASDEEDDRLNLLGVKPHITFDFDQTIEKLQEALKGADPINYVYEIDDLEEEEE